MMTNLLEGEEIEIQSRQKEKKNLRRKRFQKKWKFRSHKSNQNQIRSQDQCKVHLMSKLLRNQKKRSHNLRWKTAKKVKIKIDYQISI